MQPPWMQPPRPSLVEREDVQAITAMDEYKSMSFEELRWAGYQEGVGKPSEVQRFQARWRSTW